MQFTTRLLTGLLLVTLCSFTYAALSPATAQEEMAPTSSKQHAMIQKGVGDWEGQITLHIPGMPEPEVAPCTEVVSSLGDLWTTSLFSMEFMGTSFLGSSTLGYDTVKKKFVGTWIDNTNPTLTVMEGDYDEEKKALVLHYSMYEPMSQSTKKMRNELVASDDEYTLSFFEITDKGETLTMQMDMKRK